MEENHPLLKSRQPQSKKLIKEHSMNTQKIITMLTVVALALAGQLSAAENGDLSTLHINEISKRLNVKKEEVISMNRRLAGKEKSLNAPVKDEDGTEWQDWIVDHKTDQELKLSQDQEFDKRKKLMNNSMNILNLREREILTARRLSEDVATLEDLSKKYKVSRERIRQIETKAFEKLQKAMLNAAKSDNLLPKN